MTPSNNWPKGPAVMDKFTMITMLLRAAVTLRHKNEDLTMFEFRPRSQSKPGEGSDFENNLKTLEGFTALLTPNVGVVAALYRKGEVLIVPKSEDVALEFDMQESMMPCDIVVMANPDKKTNSNTHLSSENPLNLRFITDGEDLWPIIKESAAGNCDPLGYIAQQKSVTLESHAKTVCSYLNDFKATHSDSDDPAGANQAGYSRKFFNYLISFCWGRLHRRLTSWAGLGFVDKLNSTWLELKSSDAINEYPHWDSFNTAHTAGDSSLTNFLNKHRFILPLLDALLIRTGSFETRSFDSLTQAVKEGEPFLFTKDTATQFHRLTCGGFIMLTALLGEFKAYYKTWRNMDDETQDTAFLCFRRIGLYTRLLLNILASTSFRHYITFMVQRGVKSLVPFFENRSSYISKWERCHATLAGESPGVAPVGDVMNTAGSSQACNSVGSSSEPDKADPPDDEESEADLQALRSSADGSDIEALLRWIRSLLLQFIGKRHVEQACTDMHRNFPTSPVKIAVMSANRIHYSIPEWREFEAVIGDALDACPDLLAEHNIKSVVARLKKEFGKSKKGYGKAVAIIDVFRKVLGYETRAEPMKGKESEPFIVHCEAALIAFAEFQEAFEVFKGLSTELHPHIVSVSKLCCPICWEFITLLRDIAPTTNESPKYNVRGWHPHIYPLVLPPWIPDEIRDKMNSKFLGYLGTELRQLMATRNPAEPARAETQAQGRERRRAGGRAQERAEARAKNHCRKVSDSSILSQESTTTLSSISSNSEGEYEDGDDYYPDGATNESLFGSRMTGAYVAWKNA